MRLKFLNFIGLLILNGGFTKAHAVGEALDLAKIPEGAVVLPATGLNQSKLVEVPRGVSLSEYFAVEMGAYYKSNLLVMNKTPDANMHRWWLLNPKIIESLTNNQKPDPNEVAYYEARWVQYSGKRQLLLTKVLVKETRLRDFDAQSERGALAELSKYLRPGADRLETPQVLPEGNTAPTVQRVASPPAHRGGGIPRLRK